MCGKKCSVMLFLLLATFAANVRSIPIASETIVFPKSDENPSLPVFTLPVSATPKASKANLIKCLDLGDLMPAFNTSSGEFECYPLTERGPCKGKQSVCYVTEPFNECIDRKFNQHFFAYIFSKLKYNSFSISGKLD